MSVVLQVRVLARPDHKCNVVRSCKESCETDVLHPRGIPSANFTSSACCRICLVMVWLGWSTTNAYFAMTRMIDCFRRLESNLARNLRLSPNGDLWDCLLNISLNNSVYSRMHSSTLIFRRPSIMAIRLPNQKLAQFGDFRQSIPSSACAAHHVKQLVRL